MKKEIEKKIKELCDEAGSSAAQEIRESLTDDAEKAYDERISEGMSEIDAYRYVLSNVDEIKAMLDSLPKDEEAGEILRREKKAEKRAKKDKRDKKIKKDKNGKKNSEAEKSSESDSGGGNDGYRWNFNDRKMNRLCAALWILVTIAYFLGSFITMQWHLTWLIFLWGAVGQVIMNMVKKYNRGTPLDETIRRGLTPIMWLLLTIFYIIISFGTGLWHLTWLVFLFGAAGQVILSGVKKFQRGASVKEAVRKSLYPILWILVTILYFLLSFHTYAWHLTWLIFLFGAFIQLVMDLFLKD